MSYPSYVSISSRTSRNLDASDAMDDLDVAADVATKEARSGWREPQTLASQPARRRGARGLAQVQRVGVAPLALSWQFGGVRGYRDRQVERGGDDAVLLEQVRGGIALSWGRALWSADVSELEVAG